MIYYSDGDIIIELIYNFDVSTTFYDQILKYLYLSKYQEVTIETQGDVNQHWHILEDSTGWLLIIMKIDGTVLEVYNEAELLSAIRGVKIANLC